MYGTILKIETREDRNGKNFKNIQVQTHDVETVEHPVTGELVRVPKPSKITSFNAWEESYLDNKPEYGWNLNEGDLIALAIVKREVEEYDIPASDGGVNTVNTYSLVFPGKHEHELLESDIERAFKAAQHPIKGTSVQSTAPVVEDDLPA